MEGVDQSFASAIFLGYHAREGTPGSVLSHTFTGSMVLKLNGTEVGETGFNAAIAGDFGVPVSFISGDQATGAEAGCRPFTSDPTGLDVERVMLDESQHTTISVDAEFTQSKASCTRVAAVWHSRGVGLDT